MSFNDMSVSEFLEELAQGTPTPGGGSVAALCGALAAALNVMVAKVTHGKEKYRSAWEDMEGIMNRGDHLRKKFLELMNADAAAYQDVVKALRMPKSDSDERAARGLALKRANRMAAEVPLKTVMLLVTAGRWLDPLIEKGNPNCISDVGTAAQLIRAAAYSAAYNVRFNLHGVEDSEFASTCRRQLAQAVEEIERLTEGLDKKISAMLELK